MMRFSLHDSMRRGFQKLCVTVSACLSIPKQYLSDSRVVSDCKFSPRIYVISPNGQQQCAGEYMRMAVTANGHSVPSSFSDSMPHL